VTRESGDVSERDLACREVVELVDDYLEGAMPPPKRARFQRHLEGCPGCVAYVEQMRVTVGLVGPPARGRARPGGTGRAGAAAQALGYGVTPHDGGLQGGGAPAPPTDHEGGYQMPLEYTCETCNGTFREETAEALIKRAAAHNHEHHGGPEEMTPELEQAIRANMVQT
jgi:Putative zinc-finger/Protein of unknown function (DUF1059)